MRKACIIVVMAWLAACAAASETADQHADAPDPRYAVAATPAPGPHSHAAALAAWQRPEDIAAWLGANFRYDGERALQLSESQRALGAAPRIHEAGAFFERPVGICVDLARFGVETLNAVMPQARARYLMIEFNPATVRGQVLRRHWVTLFDGPQGLWVMADSRRPGHLAGPYRSTEAFVQDYAAYRGREIVAHRELDSFARKTRQRARAVAAGG